MVHTIDTLKIFDDLKQSFTEEQAHKLSVMFKSAIEGSLDELATKQDIAGLKQDIAGLTVITQHAIEALRAETKRDIEELRTETKRDLQALELRLKNEMQQIKYDLTMRMGAMLAASIGIIAALVKLL